MDQSELHEREISLLNEFEHGRLPLMIFLRSIRELREGCIVEPDPRLGKAVVAAFDRHTEGRDLMAMILSIEGFDVVVSGRESGTEDIIQLCKDPEVKVLCLSIQTTLNLNVTELVTRLKEEGIRDRIVFNMGGSPVTKRIADEAGCDVFATTAVESVRMIKHNVLERVDRV